MYLCIWHRFTSQALQTQGFRVRKCLYTANSGLSERQWGTVHEDFSENGDTWSYFSHDQARSRAYHWGEDGLAWDQAGRFATTVKGF
jgi:hypothetical protein